MIAGDGMPVAVARLRRNKAGYPVPWFVWTGPDGEPDFRIIKPGAVGTALAMSICWICGGLFLPRENRVFVIGSMCAVNRISAEPPCHYGCAVYAAVHCPFLARPAMKRRERHIPGGIVAPAGISIRRNPGVALVWVSRFDAWHTVSDGRSGMLFDVGEPKLVRWYCQGRAATRAEVMTSIDSGFPLLAREARRERRPRQALAELDAMLQRALALVPS